MKRHVQFTGVRNWYGADLLDLQAEALKVMDNFLGSFGAFVVSGCQVAANGQRWDVAPGIVALTGTDPDGARMNIVVPFEGAQATNLPLYLTLDCQILEDQYEDGSMQPVTYDYKAVASTVRPAEGVFVEIAQEGSPRFADVIQDPSHRFLTDGERTRWNAKETTEGAQAKAAAALAAAKVYTDTEVDSAKTELTATIPQMIEGKQDRIPIVSISDFNAFNPSSNMVDSRTGQIFTLVEGESCYFKSSYNATGKPWMGSGTNGATNNPLSAVYYWSGTITRIYGTYYILNAYGANTTTGRPQTASRVYYGSSRYDWIVGTDYTGRGTSGYTKFPGGMMIQWGAVYNSQTDHTLTFPQKFYLVYSAVTTISCASDSRWAGTARIITLGDSTLRVKVRSGDSSYTDGLFYWIAIGTWR